MFAVEDKIDDDAADSRDAVPALKEAVRGTEDLMIMMTHGALGEAYCAVDMEATNEMIVCLRSGRGQRGRRRSGGNRGRGRRGGGCRLGP